MLHKTIIFLGFFAGLFLLSGCTRTPLVKALWKQDFKTAERLITEAKERGIDLVNEKKGGCTPLQVLATSGKLPSIVFLLDHGADPNVDYGGTPLAYAKATGQTAAADLLRKAMAKPPEQVSQDRIEKIVQSAVQSSLKDQEAQSSKPKEILIHSDIDQPSYRLPQRENDFAVVVGVEKYSNDLPEAQYAERDAEAMQKHLLALGYPQRNIVLLTGQKATKTGLVKNLETWLPNTVKENSTVFFYYSGHGAPEPDTGQAYLVPVDGDPQYLKDTAYPLKHLYKKLNALKAKRIIIALDSCFSGSGGRSVLAKGIRPLVNKIDMGDVGTGKIVAFSASASNQISGTMEEEGHGAFTYYFLKGLNGGAQDRDGSVTAKSLYDYIVPNVQDAARRNNRDQTPQLMPVVTSEQALMKLR